MLEERSHDESALENPLERRLVSEDDWVPATELKSYLLPGIRIIIGGFPDERSLLIRHVLSVAKKALHICGPISLCLYTLTSEFGDECLLCGISKLVDPT